MDDAEEGKDDDDLSWEGDSDWDLNEGWVAYSG